MDVSTDVTGLSYSIQVLFHHNSNLFVQYVVVVVGNRIIYEPCELLTLYFVDKIKVPGDVKTLFEKLTPLYCLERAIFNENGVGLEGVQ